MKKPDIDKIKSFSAGLYREHIEEAAFLYDQCEVLRKDPDLSWLDIGRFEDRHETHIQALATAGQPAVELCIQKTGTGDSGELNTALTLFCRQNRLDLVWPVLDQLDPKDRESVQAAANALKHEWPEACQENLFEQMDPGTDLGREVLSIVAGFRRLPAQQAVLRAMATCPESHLYAQIWCLGRLKTQCPPEALRPYLDHADDRIRAIAAIGLSRMGVHLTDAVAADCSDLDSHHLMQIALSAARPMVSKLLTEPAGVPGASDIDLVLGLMGDPAAVAPLIQRIAHVADPASTALAINLITGADLYETMQIAEPVDEAELFDDEREALDRGAPPAVAQDLVEVNRLTMDPMAWQAWWHHNRARFQTGVRYRNGVAYSPACLLKNLSSEKSPPLVRQIAAEELVTRFAMDIPFETDMRVRDQLQALERIRAWIDAEASRFIAGRWYFSGRLLDGT